MNSSTFDLDLDFGSDKENVIKVIYSSCDQHQVNNVQAIELLNFIKKFIKDNDALEELQRLLDPDSNNPMLTSEVFHQIMSEWIDSKNQLDKSFHQLCEEDGINTTCLPVGQSTPEKSRHTLNSLTNSSLDETTHYITIHEKSFLEDKIQQLEFELNKKNSEHKVTKQQLCYSEEAIEQLQTEIKLLNKRFLGEKQAAENSFKEKKESDDLRQELSQARKKIKDLDKLNLDLEKRNRLLSSSLKDLENEKFNLERKLEEANTRKNANYLKVLKLQEELASKESEIVELVEKNKNLSDKLNEQNELLEHFTKNNELLKTEKSTLEKALKQTLLTKAELQSADCRNSSTGMSNKCTTLMRSPSALPLLSHLKHQDNIMDISDEVPTFNTPNLIRQLANPITPHLGQAFDSPILSGSFIHPNEESLSDSPITHTENFLKKILIEKSSTPEEHPILDSSLPAESYKIPVMKVTEQYGDSRSCISSLSDTDNKSPASNDVKHLPTLYLMERTQSDRDQVVASLDPGVVESVPNNVNLSSDEDIFCKIPVEILCSVEGPFQSLNAEIENAEKNCSLSSEDYNDYEDNKQNHQADNLQNEKQDWAFIVESYKKAISELLKKECNLKSDLEAKEKIISSLRNEIDKVASLNVDLYDKLHTEIKINDQLREQMKSQEAFKEMIELKDKEIAELVETVTSKSNKIDELLTTNGNSSAELNSINKYLCNAHYSHLHDAPNDPSNTVSSNVEDKSEELLGATEFEKVRTLVDSLQAAIQKRDEKIRQQMAIQNENECLKNKIKDLQKSENLMKVKMLNDNIDEKNNEIIKLKEQISKQEKFNDEMRKEMETLNKQIDTNNTVEKLCSSKCLELEERIVNLVTCNKSQKNSLNKLKFNISNCKDSLQSLNKKNKTLRRDLSQMSLKLTHELEKNMELNTRLQSVYEEKEYLKDSLETSENTIKELHLKQHHLEKELSNFKFENQALSNKISNFNIEKDNIIGKNKNLITLSKQMECLNNKLKEEVAKAVKKFKLILKDNEILSAENKKLLHKCKVATQENDNVKRELEKLFNKDILRFHPKEHTGEYSLLEILEFGKKNIDYLCSKLDLLDSQSKAAGIENDDLKSKSLKKEKVPFLRRGTFDKQQTKIDRLEDKLENTELQLKERELEIRELQEKLDNLQKITNNFHDLKCGIRSIKDKFLIERSQCQTNLYAMSTDLQQFQDKILNFVAQSEAERINLTAEKQTLQEHFNQILSDFQHQQHSIDSLKAQHSVDVSNFRLTEAEYNRIRTHNEKLSFHILNLQKMLDDQMINSQKLRRALIEAQSKNEECKEAEAKLEAKECLITELLNDIKVVKKRTINLENLVDEKNKEIAELQGVLKKAFEEVLQNKKQLSDFMALLMDSCKLLFEGNEITEENEIQHQGIICVEDKENLALELIEELNKLRIDFLTISKVIIYLVNNYADISNNEIVSEPSIDSANMAAAKPLNIFTLRHNLNVSRPLSPDSPSLEIKTFVNQTDYTTSEGETTMKPAINNDNYILDENKHQPAFPSQPDKSLGHNEENSGGLKDMKKLENAFTALALTSIIDGKTVKHRLEAQEILKRQHREDVVSQVLEIAAGLQQHVEGESLVSMGRRLEAAASLLDEALIAAEQFGALRYERQYCRNWDLAMSYVASLSKELKSMTAKSQCMESKVWEKKSTGCQTDESIDRMFKLSKLQTSFQGDNYIAKKDSSFVWYFIKVTLVLTVIVYYYYSVSAVC